MKPLMKFNRRVDRCNQRRQSPLYLELLDSRIAPATFSIADSSIIEGDEGAVNMSFTVTRAGDLAATATVGYSTVAGSATPNVDYLPQTGSLIFGPNVLTQTINVPILGDYLFENNETFTVQLTPGVTDRRATNVQLGTKIDTLVGISPSAIVAADFNRDGLQDIATSNNDSDSISVMRNVTAPGSLTLGFSDRLDLAASGHAYEVDAVDLNLDGKPDLVGIVNNSSSVVAFRNDTPLGSTVFSFGTLQPLAFVNGLGPVALGDINNDGRPDIVVGSNQNTVNVLINATAPGATLFAFQPMAFFSNMTNGGIGNVLLKDMNLDGRLDIVLSNRLTNGVAVFLNTTPVNAVTPTFAPRVDFIVNGDPLNVVAGDINNDGMPDLVACDRYSGILSIFVNTAVPGAMTPSFSPRIDMATQTVQTSVGLSDFNGDGKLDLFVGFAAQNFISVWTNATTKGSATPTFVSRTDYSTSGQCKDFSFADFNSDGKQDFVYGQWNSSYFGSFVNTTPLALTVSDLVATSSSIASNPTNSVVGDFNNDGRPDIVAGGTVASALLNTIPSVGAFPTFNSSTTGVDFGGQPWISGDVNLDGRLDLITGDGVYLNSTPVNAPSLTFTAKTTFSFAFATDSVLRFGDFDLDGRPDVLATRRDAAVGTDIRIFRNTTTPGSPTPSFASSADFSSGNVNCVDVAIADFNLDGLLDIALSTLGDGVNPSTRGIAILLNTTPFGTSNFNFGTTFHFATIRIPGAIVAGDLNNDGKSDVAFINANPATPSATIVSTYLNQTPGGSSTVFLSARQDFSTAAGPLTMAELDGDGKLDLIAIGTVSQQNLILIFQNQSTAGSTTVAFATSLEYLQGLPNASLAVGDFNNNGRVDLVVGQTTTSLNVALNESFQMLRGAATGTIVDNDPAPDTTPPGVAAVYFDSTVWTAAFRTALGNGSGFPAQTGGSQLASLPWNNVNQIRVKFSENVLVDQGDLAVRGINVANYSVVGFGYDGVNFTAVWTLVGNIDTDRLIIDLDGDSATAVTDLAGNKLAGSWTDSVSTFPTAGAPATDFRFRFVVAVGDVNRDGLVRNSDQNTVRTNLFIDAGQAGYNTFADIDGNSQTRNADLNAVRNHLFIDPPAGPGPNRPPRAGNVRDQRTWDARIVDGKYLTVADSGKSAFEIEARQTSRVLRSLTLPDRGVAALDELFAEAS